MKSYIEQVAAFHKAFCYAQPEPLEPGFSNEQTNTLRCELLREEINELVTATYDNDRIGILDALCDTVYVHAGAILAWGLRPRYELTGVAVNLRPIPDMDDHLASMLGIVRQMELAASCDLVMQVIQYLQQIESRVGRLVFHWKFERFSDAFDAVHANNLAKIWSDTERNDWHFTAQTGGDLLEFEQTKGGWIARNQGGKIIKPNRHQKVDLTSFV